MVDLYHETELEASGGRPQADSAFVDTSVKSQHTGEYQHADFLNDGQLVLGADRYARNSTGSRCIQAPHLSCQPSEDESMHVQGTLQVSYLLRSDLWQESAVRTNPTALRRCAITSLTYQMYAPAGGENATILEARRELSYLHRGCLLYTSPSPRDGLLSRMPSSA